VLFANARHIGFPTGFFDLALCGFMGWDDCFDFVHNQFIRPDKKAPEIYRVLKESGKFVCCSWESQEDLSWMENAMEQHCPALLGDPEYQQERTIGMSRENAHGYEIILDSAGFRNIKVIEYEAEFVSTDEQEFWRQMEHLGWDIYFKKIEKVGSPNLMEIKRAIFQDIQPNKHKDGIHFTKRVLFVTATK
jgi:SAM-dependent methyltransferase